ncbi:hypothetical protein ABK040_016302 [Willaertia magna]
MQFSHENLFEIQLQEYPLELRSTFGTSHSSTTKRNNALFIIKINNNFYGFGEIGLPPKKKKCYLADFNDIKYFFNEYCNFLKKEMSIINYQKSKIIKKSLKEWIGDYFPLNINNYFIPIKNYFLKENKLFTIIEILPLILLKVLDQNIYHDFNLNENPEFQYAAKCGIEMSILDVLCKILNLTLFEMIGITKPINKYSFYTVGLNEDINEMVNNTKFGLNKTKYLKFKLDDNVDKSINIIKHCFKEYNNNLNKIKWSIDANASWSPQTALQFLEKLKLEIPSFIPIFYMLEQPFPVELITNNDSEWKKVKEIYEKEGILIFADESISRKESISLMKDYIHGVNIKLEKAGGIRNALLAIDEAKQLNLKIWLGCMVSSRLSCTCSAHLMSLSEIGGDLDGDLLVNESSQLFNNGFEWRTINNDKAQDNNNQQEEEYRIGEIILPEHDGIGCLPKEYLLNSFTK